MNEQIVSSLIAGGSSIIGAIIVTGGVYKIARHRKSVINLCENIERYHDLEHKLVSMILKLNNEEVSDNMVINRKGKLRKEFLGNQTFDSMMTVKEAKKIKKRYFG